VNFFKKFPVAPQFRPRSHKSTRQWETSNRCSFWFISFQAGGRAVASSKNMCYVGAASAQKRQGEKRVFWRSARLDPRPEISPSENSRPLWSHRGKTPSAKACRLQTKTSSKACKLPGIISPVRTIVKISLESRVGSWAAIDPHVKTSTWFCPCTPASSPWNPTGILNLASVDWITGWFSYQ